MSAVRRARQRVARYAYHSFPRRDKTTRTARIRLGLAILDSMVRSGLVLAARLATPPSAELPSATSGLRIGQTFAAFTVRSRASLAHEHAEDFGSFAIEFEVDALVEMGAIPVVYLPLRDDQRSHGRLLLQHLADIALVLERLQDTSRKHPEEEFFRHLNRGLASREELIAALSALTSLVEPVEPSADAAVKYFEQREWRILQNVGTSAGFDASPPTPDEQQRLFGLDRNFWTEPIGYRHISSDGVSAEKSGPRIDRSLFLRRVRGRHFLDYARRLIVPPAALKRAQAILAAEFPQLTVEPLED
jgi:hypothetical protein